MQEFNCLNVKVLRPEAVGEELDRQFVTGSAGAAGYDITVWPEAPVTIKPGERQALPTGVAAWIQNESVVGLVFPRSGLGTKKGVRLANTVGVIDSDYQGEWMIVLENAGDEDFVVNPGDRVAQVVFMPVLRPLLSVVDEFVENTGRGTGGFGSTGVSA